MEDKNGTARSRTDGFREVPGQVYRATAKTAEDLFSAFPFYGEVDDAFRRGEGGCELRKRFLLKAVDETWVRAVEDALPALDEIVRNPDRLLAEKEKILPAGQTKKVTERSVAHLSRHTDLIAGFDGEGDVIPSKLLNVWQDETVFTYENRFVNTLIARLYGFVCRRCDAASSFGEDEKTAELCVTREFRLGDRTGRIRLEIGISEPPEENGSAGKYLYTTDLWHRAEKIRRHCASYMESPFVRTMGKAYVRPPLTRTNKLLKNVHLNACLGLWDFLGTYEGTGYEMLAEENLETAGDDCEREIGRTLEMQYVLFLSHVRNGFEPGRAIETSGPGDVIRPKFTDGAPGEEPFCGGTPDPEKDADLIEAAVRAALDADRVPEEESGGIRYRYRYSFLARLIQSGDRTQGFYGEIHNYLLSFSRVRAVSAWGYETFRIGKTSFLRMKIRGKTLCLYFALDPGDLDGKYRITDVSLPDKDTAFPSLLKITGTRAVKRAEELIRGMAESLGAVQGAIPAVDYRMPYVATRDLVGEPYRCVKEIPRKTRAPGEKEDL